MTSTRILRSLLIAALLSCASAHAGDAVAFNLEHGRTTAPFEVSDMTCQVIEGQIRCSWGGKRRG